MRSLKDTILNPLATLGVLLLFSGCVKPVPTNYDKWSPCETQNDANDRTAGAVDLSCDALCDVFVQQCALGLTGDNNRCQVSDVSRADQRTIAKRACVLGCETQVAAGGNADSYESVCKAATTQDSSIQCADVTAVFNEFCDEAVAEVATGERASALHCTQQPQHG